MLNNSAIRLLILLQVVQFVANNCGLLFGVVLKAAILGNFIRFQVQLLLLSLLVQLLFQLGFLLPCNTKIRDFNVL
jgi:hypothetical protein